MNQEEGGGKIGMKKAIAILVVLVVLVGIIAVSLVDAKANPNAKGKGLAYAPGQIPGKVPPKSPPADAPGKLPYGNYGKQKKNSAS